MGYKLLILKGFLRGRGAGDPLDLRGEKNFRAPLC